MSDEREIERVASGSPPADQAEWDPLVPSAVRRTAFGRAGDGAWPAGGDPDDRTRRRARWPLMN